MCVCVWVDAGMGSACAKTVSTVDEPLPSAASAPVGTFIRPNVLITVPEPTKVCQIGE